jgi:tetratricopeptide (TPR) repeat protein
MSKWKNTLKIFLIFLCSSAIASAIYNSTHKVPSFLYFNKFIELIMSCFILHLLLLFFVKSIQFLFVLMKRIFSKTAISTKASSNFLLYSAITLSILFNCFLYKGGIVEMQTKKYLKIEKREEIERRLKQSTNVPLKNPAQRTPLPGPLGGDLEEFQTLVRQIPNDPKAHNYLGNAYKSLGRYKEAFASYKEALRIDPNYFTVHRNLGWAYEELGRYQEAIASYKEALRIKPDYASAQNGLGNTYNKLAQYKEAIASYKEVLRINPNYFAAHQGLGNAYAELGQNKEAIASYKEALSISPKSTTVRNLLNNLEQKTAYGIEKNTVND